MPELDLEAVKAEHAAWQRALTSDDTDEWHFTATALAERIPELLAEIDAYERNIEDLNDKTLKAIRDVGRERDQARAEVHRLTESEDSRVVLAGAEVRRLRAEVERLNARLVAGHDGCVAEQQKLAMRDEWDDFERMRPVVELAREFCRGVPSAYGSGLTLPASDETRSAFFAAVRAYEDYCGGEESQGSAPIESPDAALIDLALRLADEVETGRRIGSGCWRGNFDGCDNAGCVNARNLITEARSYGTVPARCLCREPDPGASTHSYTCRDANGHNDDCPSFCTGYRHAPAVPPVDAREDRADA